MITVLTTFITNLCIWPTTQSKSTTKQLCLMTLCGTWKLLVSILVSRNGGLFRRRLKILLCGVSRLVKVVLLGSEGFSRWLDMTLWLMRIWTLGLLRSTWVPVWTIRLLWVKSWSRWSRGIWATFCHHLRRKNRKMQDFSPVYTGISKIYKSTKCMFNDFCKC